MTRKTTQRDPNFAVYYMKEKRALLEVLKEIDEGNTQSQHAHGDKTLYATAKKIVDDYFEKIGEKK